MDETRQIKPIILKHVSILSYHEALELEVKNGSKMSQSSNFWVLQRSYTLNPKH